MIDKHIISVEFDSNSFNATYYFNTNSCFSKRKIFMNCNFEMNDIMVKKIDNKH
jgi:hypothetical protein